MNAFVAMRAHRAEVAQRLLGSAPEAVAAIDWDALERAPGWLALPAAALETLQRRLGAMWCAPALRLWIDRTRLEAARRAVGASFLDAVLANDNAGAALAHRTVLELEYVPARELGTLLQSIGAAVLAASLRDGALHDLAPAVLGQPAAIDIAPATAAALVERAQALGAAA
jgi:hypothetical protein